MTTVSKETFEKRKIIGEILLKSTSIEEVKIKFDLNLIDYDKNNTKNFLKYILGFRNQNGYRQRVDDGNVGMYLNPHLIRDIKRLIKKDPEKLIDGQMIRRKILHKMIEKHPQRMNILDSWVIRFWSISELEKMSKNVRQNDTMVS